jgi:hypothetical protein
VSDRFPQFIFAVPHVCSIAQSATIRLSKYLSEAGQKAVADIGYLPLRKGVPSVLGPDLLQGAKLAVLQTEGINRESEFAKKLKEIFFQ